MSLDSNQAGQRRPSGEGGLATGRRAGACRKPKRNPKEGSCWFLKDAASSPLPLTSGLSIAEGGVNCEAATVTLSSYSTRLYSTSQH